MFEKIALIFLLSAPSFLRADIAFSVSMFGLSKLISPKSTLADKNFLMLASPPFVFNVPPTFLRYSFASFLVEKI